MTAGILADSPRPAGSAETGGQTLSGPVDRKEFLNPDEEKGGGAELRL